MRKTQVWPLDGRQNTQRQRVAAGIVHGPQERLAC